MVDVNTLLKFPGGKPSGPQKAVHEAAPTPAMDSYDYEKTVELYQIAIAVKRKGEDLVKFVDDNRESARQAGIEFIAVQVHSILENNRFQRVMDSLEDAVYRRIPITLSREGVDKVHRLEKLVAEGDHVVISFVNRGKAQPLMGQALPAYPAYPYEMGQGFSADVLKWMPVVMVGVAGIVGIIAILALSQKQAKKRA